MNLDKLKAHAINSIPLLTHSLAAFLPMLWAWTHGGMKLWQLAQLAIILPFMANLPDADTAYSHIGRLFGPGARWLEAKYGHRTITHSLMAVVAVSAVLWLSSEALFFATGHTWKWEWAAWFYGSHLLVDMVVGLGGVPLLWPWRQSFAFYRVRGGGDGERVICGVLAASCAVVVLLGDWTFGGTLREVAGSMDYAILDYRNGQGLYDMVADTDGTWARDNSRVDGATYEVMGLEGSHFRLCCDDTGNSFTAGHDSNEQLYLRRIVIRRAQNALPHALPTETATPVLVPVKIDHVFDIDTEILVKVGDVVTKGQKLADLVTWRAKLLGSPTATPTDTPMPTDTPAPTDTPMPTDTPVPTAANPPELERQKAWADLNIAIAQATAAAAPPSADSVTSCNESVESLRHQLWDMQLARDAWESANTDGLDGDEVRARWFRSQQYKVDLGVLEGKIASGQSDCDMRAAQPHEADALTLDVAAARLQAAQVAYSLAVARLIPTATREPTPTKTATPTRTPIATKTPRPTPRPAPTPEAEIFSLVAGRVEAVSVMSVSGNEAVVEVVVRVR